MNKLLLLFAFVCIAQFKRHTIESKTLTGGIQWSSPNEFQNDQDYKEAIKQAQKQFHDVCNLTDSVTWGKVEKVGFQVVQGYMWWLDVQLSNGNKYELSVYQDLEGSFKLTSCK